MQQINFPTISIGAVLAIGILSACLSAPPARAGVDQLWYVPWHARGNSGNVANILNMRDGLCLDATECLTGYPRTSMAVQWELESAVENQPRQWRFQPKLVRQPGRLSRDHVQSSQHLRHIVVFNRCG
jgi:hypothetical protein